MGSKKEVPINWCVTTVNNVYQIYGGGTPSTSKPEYWDGDIPWITSADIQDVRTINVRKYITEKGIENSTTTKAPKNSLLVVTRVGLGKIAIIKEDTCFSQDLQAFVMSDEFLVPEYTLHLLSYKLQFLKYEGRGTTISGITKKQLKDLEYPLPPLNEQLRIVAKIDELFSELDKGVESLKAAREQLKVYRQALLKHAFEGKLTEQWRKENADKLETAEQLLERIKQEREDRYQQQLEEWKVAIEMWGQNGMVGKKPSKPKIFPDVQIQDIDISNTPDGWAFIKALYISDFITKGTTPEKSELLAGKGDVPFIKVYNLTMNGKLDFSIEPTFVSKSIHNGFLSRSKCRPGDILMNIVGPPLGKVSVVPNTYPEWNINQAIVRYRTNIIEGTYLSNYLLSDCTVRSMVKTSKATAGQFNLTLETCRDMMLPVCSISEQREINSLLDEVFSVMNKLELDIDDNLSKSEALRQSILKKAFSGQLVPQDPNDEPASVLLERIAREKAEAAARPRKSRTSKAAPNV